MPKELRVAGCLSIENGDGAGETKDLVDCCLEVVRLVVRDFFRGRHALCFEGL